MTEHTDGTAQPKPEGWNPYPVDDPLHAAYGKGVNPYTGRPITEPDPHPPGYPTPSPITDWREAVAWVDANLPAEEVTHAAPVAAAVEAERRRRVARAEADAGRVGISGPRDPAKDWAGEDTMTRQEAEAAYRRRLASWDEP